MLIIFSMTADVQAMIHNDQPSSRGRRIAMCRQDRELYQLHMQNFPKHSSRREFNYIRQLRTYIRASRYQLIWMYVTLAPRENIVLLKSFRRKKIDNLASVTRSIEEGWMATRHGMEIPNPHNKFHALGAEILYGRCHPQRTQWIMLRDNW